MPIVRVDYRGYSIQASAYEVDRVGRFMASLTILAPPGAHQRELLHLPVGQRLFPTAREALDAAIEQAHMVIDRASPLSGDGQERMDH